jgi:OFA family oxalate/formate antiporter-like MFS transporter
MSRTQITIAGTMVMLTQGSVYAYTALFGKSIGVAYGTSPLVSLLPFLMVTLCIAIGELVGGLTLDRVSAKTMALCGTVAWAFGTMAAALGLMLYPSVFWLVLGYGIIGGLGAGFANVAVVKTMVQWYPERLGLGSGLALAGFGFGASIYGLIVSHVPFYGQLATAVSQPDGGTAAFANSHLAWIFLVSGAVFGLVSITGAAMLEESPYDMESDGIAWASTMELIRNADILILWMIMLMNVGSGLYVLTNVLTIIGDLTNAPIPVIAGICSFVGLANGAGRVFYGVLSDYIDRRKTTSIIFAVQALTFTALTLPIAHNLWVAVSLVGVVMFSYGGLFGVMPALVASTVGLQNFSRAYGIVLSGWGLASLVGSTGAVLSRSMPALAMLNPIILLMLMGLIFPMLVSSLGSAKPRATTA